ncbi:MAG: 50S ribosomal protein L13 [Phycisphaeraceae bacterium]
MNRQTYFAKAGDIEQNWHVIDANGRVLGRLASELATILMGKHKPTYTPHIDTGDFVVVTNASKIRLTGRKADQRFHTRYSGYPGGLKAVSFGQMREERPERLLELAVRRMLPKSSLGQSMLKKLKVYAGSEHPHAAQQPQPLEV